ncbi:MAG: short-chain dehydrogenase [Verrucomicrobiales bacterium]|nr:short-chain dehydrogenase [Verrucomicrobiales bacterium]
MNVEPTSQDTKGLIKKALIKLGETEAKLKKLERERTEPIAIVGIGCRFPGGVTDPDSFWKLLCDGVDAISVASPERWESCPMGSLTEQEKRTINLGGFIPGAAEFDASFFGVTPREAKSIDPQHRLALEVAWEALEDANIPATSLEKSKGGVFLGLCTGDYQYLLKSRGINEQDAYLAVGTAPCVAAGRISNFLNWTGPSIAIDTACSSSLVSVHMACQSLRLGESSLALAGGVNRILSPEFSVNFSRAGMLAPDGRCKTFDAGANGFVRAEGCGMVVLKRLSDAVQDKNNILAVIRGSAVNQDGRTSGITVPNGPAQQRVIREALKNARIEPGQIDYVESHGTGTSLGDPIEMEALEGVYGSGRQEPLLVGSVKTNIGHCEAAAGIAGLIKSVLMLQREKLVSHLHFREPNPLMRWAELGIRVCARPREWARTGRPRRVGVSSFGFSGTNSHIILEEGTLQVPASKRGTNEALFLALTAKSEAAIRELASRYLGWFETAPDFSWSQICSAAYDGRAHLDCRLAIVAGSVHEAIGKLKNYLRVGFGDGIVSSINLAGVGPSETAAEMTARLFCAKKLIAESFFEKKDRNVPLPKYPFQREVFWVKSIKAPPRPTNDLDTIRSVLTELSNSTNISDEERALFPGILARLGERMSTQNDWFYKLEWREELNWVSPIAFPPEWPRTFGSDPGTFSLPGKPGVDEILGLFERSTLNFVLRAFHNLALAHETGSRLTAASLMKKGGIIPRHETLFRRCLEILEEENILARHGEEWCVVAPMTVEPGTAQIEFNGKLSDYKVELALLNRCGLGLADVLSGKVDPLQLLFPKTGLGVSELYLHSASLTRGTKLLVSAVENVIGNFSENRGIRILEIGAGTGAVAAELLPSLKERVEYWFTDISPTLVHAAKMRFKKQGSLKFAVLDLEKRLEENEIQSGYFDLIIASNVVHATADLKSSLSSIKQLLRPGGIVCLQESTISRRWSDLIFGMAQGWWNFTDKHVRPTHPLISPLKWNQLLGESGFEKYLHASESKENLAPQSVMIAQSAAEQQEKVWVVIGKMDGTFALRNLLESRGNHVVRISPGSTYKESAGNFEMALSSSDDWNRFFARMGDVPGNLEGVIWLAEASASSEPHQAIEECFRLLMTVKAWAGYCSHNPITFCLVTRQEVAVGQNDFKHHWSPSLIWGFGRALSTESLPCRVRLIDTPADLTVKAQSLIIADELFGESSTSQVVFRDQTRWVPRLARFIGGKSRDFILADQGTYLITGGFGFLGLRLAVWLVENGVKSLALVGKSGAISDEAQTTVASLRNRGVKIAVFRADVADKSAVEKLFAEMKTSLPVLRGVFHLAGVNQFDLLLEIDREKFEKVSHPKVLGGWNLHEATKSLDLDLFVSFSSGASIWGAQKQAHYAAANFFLDSLAHYRAGMGLPALSINWGLLAATGSEKRGQGFDMQERLDYQEWLGEMGILGMRPEQGFDRMLELLGGKECQVTIANVDWKSFREVYEAKGKRPFFSELNSNPPVAKQGKTDPGMDSVLKSVGATRKVQIQRWLKLELGSVMGIEKWEDIDAGRGFFDMGLDSLMAVQFKNNLEKTSGLQLPGTLAFDYPNLNKLAQFMEEEFFENNDGEIEASLNENPGFQTGEVSSSEIERELAELDKLLAKGS